MVRTVTVDPGHLNKPDFFHQDPCIITKMLKNTQMAMFKKLRKHSWICPFTWICTKSFCGLFWAETHLSSNFCGNPKNRHGRKHNLRAVGNKLGGGNKHNPTGQKPVCQKKWYQHTTGFSENTPQRKMTSSFTLCVEKHLDTYWLCSG